MSDSSDTDNIEPIIITEKKEDVKKKKNQLKLKYLKLKKKEEEKKNGKLKQLLKC